MSDEPRGSAAAWDGAVAALWEAYGKGERPAPTFWQKAMAERLLKLGAPVVIVNAPRQHGRGMFERMLDAEIEDAT